jgi:hypothetical protein
MSLLISQVDAGADIHSLPVTAVHIEQGQPHGFVHQTGVGSTVAANRVRLMAVDFIKHFSKGASIGA